LADAYGTIKDNYNVKIYLITTHPSTDYTSGLENLDQLVHGIIEPAHLENEIILSNGIYQISEQGLGAAEKGKYSLPFVGREIPFVYGMLAEHFGVNVSQMILVDDNSYNRSAAEAGNCKAVAPDPKAVLALFQDSVNPGMNKAHRPAPA